MTLGAMMGRIARTRNRLPYLGSWLWVAAVYFFVSQILAANPWRAVLCGSNGGSCDRGGRYSLFQHTISDLGVTSHGRYRVLDSGSTITSPWHLLFNSSLVVLGALIIVGAPFLYHDFADGKPDDVTDWAKVAFGLQAVAGVGTILVGTNPENALGRHWLHIGGAFLGILVGSVSVLLLAIKLRVPGRRFLLVTAPMAIVAIVLFAIHEYLGLGPGGMERVGAYPEVIWVIMLGYFVWRGHIRAGNTWKPAKNATVTPLSLTYHPVHRKGEDT